MKNQPGLMVNPVREKAKGIGKWDKRAFSAPPERGGGNWEGGMTYTNWRKAGGDSQFLVGGRKRKRNWKKVQPLGKRQKFTASKVGLSEGEEPLCKKKKKPDLLKPGHFCG